MSQATHSTTKASTMAKVTNLPFTVREYSFFKFIGKGGFAEVFLVTHLKYGQEFVAKVMTVDPSEMEHRWEIFDAEIQALISLNHPHIIRMYDHFHVNTQFYLILEYCPGGSLHDEIVKTNGLSSYGRFLDLATQLVQALAYCHSQNIAHRDIKPGNILMDEFRRSKIADFGLSLVSTAGQLHRQFGGSYMYSAPEIFQKKAHDPQAGDVWALGVVFTLMLTGSKPWQCDSFGALKQQAAQGLLHFSKKIPDIAEDLIRKMLTVDPNKRITMGQVKQHPLFTGQSCPNRNSLPKHFQLKWDQIKRVQGGNDNSLVFPDEFEIDEENDPLVTYSNVFSASSKFIHSGRIEKPVKPRIHHTQTNNHTFKSFECEEMHEL